MPLSAFFYNTSASLTRHASEGICHAYVAYHTFRAIQSEAPEQQQAWITFWIIHSPFLLAERMPMGLRKLPLYHPLKFLLILWLTLPRFRGAQLLYDRFVLPLLSKHEQAIDTRLAAWKSQAQATTEELTQKGWAQLKALTAKLAVQFAQLVSNSIKASQAAARLQHHSPPSSDKQPLALLPSAESPRLISHQPAGADLAPITALVHHVIESQIAQPVALANLTGAVIEEIGSSVVEQIDQQIARPMEPAATEIPIEDQENQRPVVHVAGRSKARSVSRQILAEAHDASNLPNPVNVAPMTAAKLAPAIDPSPEFQPQVVEHELR